MAIPTTPTIDDFERLPAETVRSGNTPRHNLVRDSIVAAVRAWIAENDGGVTIAGQEYDFGGNIYGPDVSYFGADKKPLLDLDERVQRFVPDLAVEVVSADDLYVTMMRKLDQYRRAETSEVWLVSTEPTEIAIYTAGGGRILGVGDTITSDLLPGFAITVDDLFRGL